MLNIFEFLLGTGRAWKLRIGSFIRDFFDALFESALLPVQEFANQQLWDDLDPQKTEKITQWEQQFGVQFSADTEQARRDRIAAEWINVEEATAPNIQEVLRAAGFDVYVYTPWDGVDVLDPNDWLGVGYDPTLPPAPIGYIVGALQTERVFASTMEAGNAPTAEAGNAPTAEAGNAGFVYVPIFPTLPPDPDTWFQILYISSDVFTTRAQIPTARREEFETLCRKIIPGSVWFGLIVEYT